MTLFENPIALGKTAEQLEQAIRRHEQQLLRAEIEPSGPFLGKPRLSQREAFREIREAPLPDPLKHGWLRWAFRFSNARVNAPLHAASAEAYRVERHLIDPDKPITMTLQELLHCVLSSAGQRQYYLTPLARQSSRLSTLVFEQWTRRVELARRAGFASLDEAEAPTANLEELAESLLRQTDDLRAQLVPATLEHFLEAAHGNEATVGFPAKLTPRTLREMLGSDDWFAGLQLQVTRLPVPLSPASFCRGLLRVGAALVDAAAPSGQPFVVARDPGGLERRKLGALLGSLPQNAAFGRHRLGVSRPVAQQQARVFALSGMLYVRTIALSVLLRAKLCRSRNECERDYVALCHRTFGFTLPQALAGLLPRLFPDAGQRLLGPCLSSVWSEQLIAEFDEDWFRNPRGIERVRASISQTPEVAIAPELAQDAVDQYVQQLIRKLG